MALAVGILGCAYGPAVANSTIRVRVSWGGGAACQWQGQIEAAGGVLLEPVPLGIEGDEPGSMWLDAGRLHIRQRSPRTYDGVELLVSAPDDASLFIRLFQAADSEGPRRIEVPLAKLANGPFDTNLDQTGNQLMIRRAPGDSLRVQLGRDSLIFAPGEPFSFDLLPYLLPVDPGSKLRIHTELAEARSANSLWSADHDFLAGELTPIRVNAVSPNREGVYDLVITASQTAWLQLPQAGLNPLRRSRTIALRKIQFLVLDRLRPEVPVGPDLGLTTLEKIDPTISSGWKIANNVPQIPRLKQFRKGPLGNDRIQTLPHPLGEVASLQPSPPGADASWEAYTLSVKNPGMPHVLEIDYPSDVPQTLSVSIVEPNAMGAVSPLGLDSGIELAREVVGTDEKPRWLTHRLVFWPRTKTPIVLIANRRDATAAGFGEIRLAGGWEHLPRAFPFDARRPGRLAAAYLDRPLFPENFSAEDARGSIAHRGVDDWLTFYQGGSRLVEYLNHVGLGGLMISVFADGSTIYPSRLLEPTPHYDTGVFLEEGQDPIRKDVLEMLLVLFDREELQLIPALEFGSPLPELEAVLRQGGSAADGIQWIGSDGLPLTESRQLSQPSTAYYNVLNPLVQQALLAVVREVVARYGRHPSFAGLGLQLSADGYALLPGPQWGMDDRTILEFEQDMGITVPGAGPDRFRERAEFLTTRHAEQWLAWRAARLGQFYRLVRAELGAIRPDGRLYLAGARLWAGDDLQRKLKPALPQQMTLEKTLLDLGIDAADLRADEHLVLLRPELIAPDWSLARQAINLEVDRMLQADTSLKDFAVPGSLFFHQPQETPLASFDEKNPHQPSFTWLATEAVPSAARNRRRFVRSLAAIDAAVMFDGGWQLPLGQEDSIRDLLDVYRRLPAIPLRRVSDQADSVQAQPVTIRYANLADGTYAYVLNEAPFPVTAAVRVSAPPDCRVEELTGRRSVAPLRADAGGSYWSVELDPYDLVGIWLSSPGVRLSRPEARWDAAIDKILARKVDDLKDRTAASKTPMVMKGLLNPDFEKPATDAKPIPGWAGEKRPGVTIALDAARKHGGTSALRITSQGPVATLVSEPFAPPATGRLSVAVYISAAPGVRQSPLRLTVHYRFEGKDFFPNATFQVPQGLAGWHPTVVSVNDLPMEGLSQLQLGFDLMGPGDVWIDDLQLYDLLFTKNERAGLIRVVTPADHSLQQGQIADCIRRLEGYWPRFLIDNVPLASLPANRQEDPRQTPPGGPPDKPEPSPGFTGRIKDFMPEKLQFWR
jgi:hypothetical protein